jgi:thioredoxin
MIQELTKQTLATLDQHDIVFLDFYAIWCGPCMMIKPTIQKLAEEFKDKATFFFVNVDEMRDLAISYRVSSIPTIVCLKNGKQIWSHTGTINETELKKIIQMHTA